MAEPLSAEELAVVREEQDLLARVLAALAASPRRSPVSSPARRVARLRELRDEALTASPGDLPALLQQMETLRGLAAREPPPPPPDPATPYFAHLRLRTARGTRDWLLGRAAFTDPSGEVRVADWRFAPVARIFYGYREGDPFEEEFPGGPVEGAVEARRVVVVERGELTRVVAGQVVLARRPDGDWERATGPGSDLGGGAGRAARPGCLGVGVGVAGGRPPEITALLDSEQYDAAGASPDRPLLVVGGAGSGKTTVALHRLAKLGFDAPARFPARAMRVVVPEEGLARLARRLLSPLGLETAEVVTLERWLRREAAASLGGRVRVGPESPPLVCRLKRHPALRGPLLERAGSLPSRSFHRMRQLLAEVFTDRGLLASVVEAAAGGLPSTCIEETRRHTLRQLDAPSSREYRGFAPEALATLDGRGLEEGTPEEAAGTLDLEDLALLLFLRAHGGGPERRRLAHLVLDEAEDFSLFELFVLGRQLGGTRSLTLAGDELQQTRAGWAGWAETLEAVGAKGAAVCRLQTSYRCPAPVVALSRQVLGAAAPEEAAAGRPGPPVGFHRFPEEAQAHLFLAGALRELADREPKASVAVVAATPSSARGVHLALQDLPGVRLVLDGAFSFEPGIDVVDVDAVKGLEFDYVVVPDATAKAWPDEPEARRRLHVAVTRAAHQLWLVWSGRGTPLLGAVANGAAPGPAATGPASAARGAAPP